MITRYCVSMCVIYEFYFQFILPPANEKFCVVCSSSGSWRCPMYLIHFHFVNYVPLIYCKSCADQTLVALVAGGHRRHIQCIGSTALGYSLPINLIFNCINCKKYRFLPFASCVGRPFLSLMDKCVQKQMCKLDFQQKIYEKADIWDDWGANVLEYNG